MFVRREFGIFDGNRMVFYSKSNALMSCINFKLDSKLINLTQQISAIIFDVSLK